MPKFPWSYRHPTAHGKNTGYSSRRLRARQCAPKGVSAYSFAHGLAGEAKAARDEK